MESIYKVAGWTNQTFPSCEVVDAQDKRTSAVLVIIMTSFTLLYVYLILLIRRADFSRSKKLLIISLVIVLNVVVVFMGLSLIWAMSLFRFCD